MFAKKKTSNLVNLTPATRCEVFIERGIIVPPGARCCSYHIEHNSLKKDAINAIEVVSNVSILDNTSITQLLHNARNAASKNGLDFDSPNGLSDTDYYRLTGVYKKQFDSIAECIRNNIRSTSVRSYRTCLAILLTKLRTGLSHSVLSTLFSIEKRSIGKAVASARNALMQSFVPKFLGTSHISREKLISDHTRNTAKYLFANGQNVCILVVDGTYIYIQKSSNYTFQRRSYSMHKGRNLLKPMMFVSTTGYIVDVLGPYFADGKNNDANILNSLMMSDASELRRWLSPNDVFVVDRGFRDSLEMLEELGFVSKMPNFLEKKAQHTSDEANQSRLVTNIRWVVEAVNGLLKQWKALNQVFPNSQIPFLGQYVRIVCALCNAFRPPRVSDNAEDAIISERMLQLVGTRNLLQQRVEQENWARKNATWIPVTVDTVVDFPKLTENELRFITLGSYQIKQAKSYTQEHLASDGMYKLFIHKESTDILRVRIQSRHITSKQYNLWIQYTIGINPITGWYCQCKTGVRTVGCCAHIASVLWYLGYFRNSGEVISRLSSQYTDYVDDAVADWSETDD